MRHKMTQDEVHDTLNHIIVAEPFADLQDVKYGYDDGRVIVFVKDGDEWYQLHTDPPNPTILAGLKARGS